MDDILEYCSTTWGVTFPVFDKVKVNGRGAAPLYKELKKAPDADGKAGRVAWNFEKFLVLPPTARSTASGPKMKPDDPAIVGVIEAQPPALTAAVQALAGSTASAPRGARPRPGARPARTPRAAEPR